MFHVTHTCKLFVGYCNGWQSQQPYFNCTLRACFTNHIRIESEFVHIHINITPHFVHCAKVWKKHNRCTRGRQPYKCTRRDFLDENHDTGVVTTHFSRTRTRMFRWIFGEHVFGGGCTGEFSQQVSLLCANITYMWVCVCVLCLVSLCRCVYMCVYSRTYHTRLQQ